MRAWIQQYIHGGEEPNLRLQVGGGAQMGQASEFFFVAMWVPCKGLLHYEFS